MTTVVNMSDCEHYDFCFDLKDIVKEKKFYVKSTLNGSIKFNGKKSFHTESFQGTYCKYNPALKMWGLFFYGNYAGENIIGYILPNK